MEYRIGHCPVELKIPRPSKHGWRTCSACKAKKRANHVNFSPSKATSDGCQYVCRSCELKQKMERHAANADEHKERSKATYRRNAKKRRADAVVFGAARRAIIQPSLPITTDDLERMLHCQSGHCYYCGTDITDRYHLEHKTPLSRGGEHSLDNVCLACPSCNASKGSKTEDEFVEWAWKMKGVLLRLRDPSR